jgi:hypothetical protein
MEKVILIALRDSVLAWKHKLRLLRTGRAREITFGSSSCPLCNFTAECADCPVGLAGHNGCDGSPYDYALLAVEQYRGGVSSFDAAEKAIKAEIKFLKSLLPKKVVTMDMLCLGLTVCVAVSGLPILELA